MVTKKKAKPKAKKAVKRPKTKDRRPKTKDRRPKTKKAAAKKAAGKAKPILPVVVGRNLEKIGKVTHYFPHVNAAAVKMMKGGLKVGDEVYIKGHTTDFRENVMSVQFDRKPIPEAKKGQEIGLLVKSRVRQGDTVYKII